MSAVLNVFNVNNEDTRTMPKLYLTLNMYLHVGSVLPRQTEKYPSRQLHVQS